MGEQLPSRIALVVDGPGVDVRAIVAAARASGGVDRVATAPGSGDAVEVHWGGRLQRAVVRGMDGEDGVPLLRTEALIGSDGVVDGLARQAALLSALADAVTSAGAGRALGVRDLAARVERDLAWLERMVGGGAGLDDAVTFVVAGEGPARWIHTHGAARFGVPDLELYDIGTAPGAIRVALDALRGVMAQLLAGGIGGALSLEGGPRVRLIPVLEAWPRLPLSLPGIGRAGVDRGPGLDGPRATLSVLHRPRLGRHRLDLSGVIDHLRGRAASSPGAGSDPEAPR
jgi:hypothetical protein